jgi:hypothetical protein
MTKRFWQPENAFFLALLFFFLLIGRTNLFRDPGTFWHVVVGDRILSTGFFDTDPFSFTRAGRTWIPNQWLAECSMAVLHRAAEFDGLLLYAVVVLAATYALVGGRFVRAGFHWLPTMLLIGVVIGASSHHFHARPHILTILLLAWTFGRLCDVEAGRSPVRSLSWLVPVFVLWTNWHGGMLGGLATLLLTVAGWCTVPLLGWPSPASSTDTATARGRSSKRTAAALAGVAAGCAVTMLVTPYGHLLPGAWLAIMRADLPTMIIEHRPLDLFSTEGLNNLLLGLLYVAALLGTWPKHKPRVTWLVPLFWLWQGWSRMRHAPLFAVTAAIALADILPKTRWLESLAEGSDLFRPPAGEATENRRPATARDRWLSFAMPLVWPLGTVVVIFALEFSGLRLPLVGRGWAKPDPAVWPFELVEDLRAAGKQPQPRIFNELAFGGFLMMYAPELPVFIDDRCELYVPELLPAYVEALRADPATRTRRMEEWTKQYGLNIALTHAPTAPTSEPGRPFDDYFRSPKAQALGWHVVRQTTAATLFARSDQGTGTQR